MVSYVLFSSSKPPKSTSCFSNTGNSLSLWPRLGISTNKTRPYRCMPSTLTASFIPFTRDWLAGTRLNLNFTVLLGKLVAMLAIMLTSLSSSSATSCSWLSYSRKTQRNSKSASTEPRQLMSTSRLLPTTTLKTRSKLRQRLSRLECLAPF
jgi:hypothetical protein